jgi:hypothetical protein
MSKEIADAVAARLLLEPDLSHVQGTVSLRPLSVRKFAQIKAALEAGDFYNRHLHNCPQFDSWIDHLVFTSQKAAGLGDGLFMEFGVASGTTITAIANATRRPVAGFDSFNGLPEDWRDGVPAGAFATAPPKVPANVTLWVGMIEEQLPRYLESTPGEIRFIHIDTDLYGVAKYILDACRDRMNDTVVVFDEFFNYPGYVHHEFKAWAEFQGENDQIFDFRYLGLGGEVAVSAQVTRKRR